MHKTFMNDEPNRLWLMLNERLSNPQLSNTSPASSQFVTIILESVENVSLKINLIIYATLNILQSFLNKYSIPWLYHTDSINPSLLLLVKLMDILCLSMVNVSRHGTPKLLLAKGGLESHF